MRDSYAASVARAIAASATPVVSAVGHEVDYTIADVVADLRAPTPTAAAELVSPSRMELLARLDKHRQRLARGMRRHSERYRCRYADVTDEFAIANLLIPKLSARGHHIATLGSAALGELSIGDRAGNKALDI